MNFQLNEKVKIADADNIGTVADKMRSEKTGKNHYKILFEDGTDGYFEEGELMPAGGAWEEPAEKYCPNCGAKMDGGESE